VKDVRILEISLVSVIIATKYGDLFMNLKIVLEPSEDGGYTVIVPSLPGCISEGDTKDEAIKNIKEAIALYLEPVDDDMVYSRESEELELAI
jgi:predicted RNase H-like HicB family nuclease